MAACRAPQRRSRGDGSGQRDLSQRLKTARGRKASSQRWLERQLNDPYVARSKTRRFSLARRLQADRDRRPFSAARKRAGASSISAPRPAAGRRSRRSASARPTPSRWSSPSTISAWTRSPESSFIEKDFLDPDAPDLIKPRARRPAAPTSSSPTWRRRPPATARPTICASSRSARRRRTSPAKCSCPAARSSRKSFAAARRTQLLADLKRDFAKVQHVKPPASRADSPELYLLATGFRGKT